MIDHVTFEVWDEAIRSGNLENFLTRLGLKQIDVQEDVPVGWNVAWYTDAFIDRSPKDGSTVYSRILHFVEVPPGDRMHPNESPYLGAGHFCVDVPYQMYKELEGTDWVERNSGSHRLWLRAYGLRVEVRVLGIEVEPTKEGFQAARERPAQVATLSDEEVIRAGAVHCGAQSDVCGFLIGHNGGHSWEVEAIDGYVQSEWDKHDNKYMHQNAEGPIQRSDIPLFAKEHAAVLDKALSIYIERHKQYGDKNWRREGMKGSLFNLRQCVQRAWDTLWGRKIDEFDSDYVERDLDDLVDAINYAVFTIRAVDEGIEGDWFN